MLIEKFIKKIFISFYCDEKFYLYAEIIRNNNKIKSFKKEFEEKKELENEIKNLSEDYTQYYISTIIDSINQGVVPTCDKHTYKDWGIDMENVTFVCVKNKYSLYTSLYDLMSVKKSFNLDIDFLYSIFAPIDFIAKQRNNYLYVLILNTKIAFIAYQNNIPIFSEIDIFEKENEENEEIEPIDDINIAEDISEDIEEEANAVNLKEEKIEKSDIEYNIIEKLKKVIKDYYENYSEDFLEKIIFLDTVGMNNSLIKIVEDELFMDSEIKKTDLLQILNSISKKNV